ncbi:MAG: hypothetical protein GX807_00255, partial [Erysipelotrichia bacterium]|nr:hypothetical protein [Erysipelotrichia bacterium]
MFSIHDEKILRTLAKQVKEASLDPINASKKSFWYRHNSLKGERPAVFVHPDGAWNEFLPHDSLECELQYAKHIESLLKKRIFRHTFIHDDVPIEDILDVQKVFTNSMWGLSPKFISPNAKDGAWHHEPIITKPSDWEQLKMPVVEYNAHATAKRYEAVQNLLGDILKVNLVGEKNFSFHMLHWYCDYRGLENLYMDLILEPEMVHRQIRFFRDGLISMYKKYEEQ